MTARIDFSRKNAEKTSKNTFFDPKTPKNPVFDPKTPKTRFLDPPPPPFKNPIFDPKTGFLTVFDPKNPIFRVFWPFFGFFGFFEGGGWGFLKYYTKVNWSGVPPPPPPPPSKITCRCHRFRIIGLPWEKRDLWSYEGVPAPMVARI